ncbi:hypothetical protein KP509_01G053200 [Ceratopteris richardii]|nr:hypothetical protein KP509_01G053200 [Ceratopteris richardii]KAH7446380.1 hypothetical protein KP509_01G053200 [Ceratopteris richardii]KAH7446381.1 hypothetical protein KP509_01G053200 [Ceratopteris richardii]
MRNYKSYGAWHHRKWVLHFGLSNLDKEYRLLDKLLTSDARNFHGWAYRRFLAGISKATEEQELQYTIKKINENFSNYSAWHSRSTLLSKQLQNNIIEKDTWLKVLTEEYDLVQQAFFTEPDDQSGWFYLLWLLSQTVFPSRPFVTGFWPPNGHSNLFDPNVPSMANCNILIFFSLPVCGVNSETVSMSSSSEGLNSEFKVSWISITDDSQFSKGWRAELTDCNKCLEAGMSLTLNVQVGAKPGITSRHGPLLGVHNLTVNIELGSSSCSAPEKHYSRITWPEECKQTSKFEDSPNDIFGCPSLPLQRHLEPLSEWQEKTLTNQINTCRELLELENDSKWAMLMLARLLVAYDQFASSSEHGMDEVQQLYKRLLEVDPTHQYYYNEQLSLIRFHQITVDLHESSEHFWRSDQTQNLWVRFNHLSLSKLGYFERLTGVQNLDLSKNKLQSLEGIEMLQFLVNLDVSNNHLTSITALRPVSHLPKLQALNIKWNEIGKHMIDKNRYLFPTVLNNSAKKHLKNNLNKEEGPVHWEVYEIFGRMLVLRQLDIHGNPISENEAFRSNLLLAVPSLVWLDAENVSTE